MRARAIGFGLRKLWNPLAVGSSCKIGKFCGTAAIPSRAVPCIIGMVRQKLPVRPFRRFRSA